MNLDEFENGNDAQEILALADRFGFRNEGIEAVKRGESKEVFREKILDRMARPKPMLQNQTRNYDGEGFPSFGHQLQAVMRAEMGGLPDPRLQARAATGLGENVPSDGGFLIQPEFSAELLRRTYEGGEILSRCRRVPIGMGKNGLKINSIDEDSRVTGSRLGGIQAYWANEGDEGTPKKPKFRQMHLDLKKIIGVCYATDELLADAAALESVISTGFQEEFIFMTEDAIIEGNGAGKPLGIKNSGALLTVAKEPGQLPKTVVVENIVDMWARLFKSNKRNAVWLINQDITPQLFTMGVVVGTGGVPVYMPPGGLSQSPYGTLMGRPVVEVEYAETLGTAGDIMLADLGEYLLIDKDGVNAQSSIHVRFLQDEMTFKFTYRVDGQPIWKKALTPFKGTNTVSPFVQLETRS